MMSYDDLKQKHGPLLVLSDPKHGDVVCRKPSRDALVGLLDSDQTSGDVTSFMVEHVVHPPLVKLRRMRDALPSLPWMVCKEVRAWCEVPEEDRAFLKPTPFGELDDESLAELEAAGFRLDDVAIKTENLFATCLPGARWGVFRRPLRPAWEAMIESADKAPLDAGHKLLATCRVFPSAEEYAAIAAEYPTLPNHIAPHLTIEGGGHIEFQAKKI